LCVEIKKKISPYFELKAFFFDAKLSRYFGIADFLAIFIP
jgi:hypothetical protein